MHVFFSGIGGAGIGALAEIALDSGYEVSGSDLQPSLQTAELERRGVRISYEQNFANIAAVHAQNPIDWLVYTAALPDSAPELEFARAAKIRFSKRDEFLSDLIKTKNLELIAVAGTHGKTTTTAMLIWALQQLGRPISYSVGSTLSFGPSGKLDADSKLFIYEADEYDRNFLHFWPKLALLPALDHDHADIYPTKEDYNAAFRQFISQSKRTILWRDAALQLNLVDSDENLTILYGTVAPAEIDLPGDKTRANAKLVLETLRQILDDFDEVQIRQILAKFPGAARRFEQLNDNLFSDYAHHPAEIAASVQRAREMSEKIAVVYQPHQNLRQTEIVNAGGYGVVFSGVDKIFWTPTYLVRDDLADGAPAILTPENLVATLSGETRVSVKITELDDELWVEIQDLLNSGYLVLIMGAGPIDAWARGKLRRS